MDRLTGVVRQESPGMRMFAGDLGDILRRLKGFNVLKVKVQGLQKSKKEVKNVCKQGDEEGPQEKCRRWWPELPCCRQEAELVRAEMKMFGFFWSVTRNQNDSMRGSRD